MISGISGNGFPLYGSSGTAAASNASNAYNGGSAFTLSPSEYFERFRHLEHCGRFQHTERTDRGTERLGGDIGQQHYRDQRHRQDGGGRPRPSRTPRS